MSTYDNSNVQAGRPHYPRHESVQSRVRALRTRFHLEGISSSFDAERLERRLTRQIGVMGASVNPITNCAHVAYDPALTSPSLLAKQMELSGYRVRAR